MCIRDSCGGVARRRGRRHRGRHVHARGALGEAAAQRLGRYVGVLGSDRAAAVGVERVEEPQDLVDVLRLDLARPHKHVLQKLELVDDAVAVAVELADQVGADAARDERRDRLLLLHVHQRVRDAAERGRKPADGKQQIEDEEGARRLMLGHKVAEADRHAGHQRKVEAVAPVPPLGEVHHRGADERERHEADERAGQLLQMHPVVRKLALGAAHALAQPRCEPPEHRAERRGHQRKPDEDEQH
eukprot:3142099-Prymnesium_polylepis.1